MKLIYEAVRGDVILFGTGRAASRFLEIVPIMNIIFFVDNNEKKWGAFFNERPIHPPSEIIKSGISAKVIITSEYHDEIANQLLGMGLEENVHFYKAKDLLFEVYGGAYAPGHFYSPVPDVKKVIEERENIFRQANTDLPGINIDIKKQVELLRALSVYYSSLPWGHSDKQLRFTFNNRLFCETDSLILFSLLRHLQPKRIIEVGGGYTTALMLDVRDIFTNVEFDLKTIEPYPDRLNSLLGGTTQDCFELIQKPVQGVDLSCFDKLQSGDILFVDSSHVSKVGSDVNYILFEIIPRLKEGVYIHFHDIFFPFEYPENWIAKGRYWNEAYLLRAFLQFNQNYQIVFWNDMAHKLFKDEMESMMPLSVKNSGGSLWLQKVRNQVTINE
ncbi:class I SAM-dependent methyltransferase [Cohnella sp.]|uniref:class I SAM-dependent methyltransferase n=1 Tax=Cohnella sp. TaxID=1883426 RepID=UPI00356230FA